MKLNWFSPLLPAKSGIANYTSHLLPALAARAEITLWTDQAEWDPTLEAYAHVRSFDAEQLPWREVNEAEMSIYHLGNNAAFHHSIWRLNRQHAGVVVLHDLSLQHLFAKIYQQAGNAAQYLEAMGRYYGRAGHRAAVKFGKGTLSIEYMAEHYPLTHLALENALGVVLHNREAATDLQRRNRWPALYAPLPFPANHRLASTKAQAIYKDWLKGPYRLIVFGYIGPTRRLDSLLEALAGHPHREQFRLDLIGDVWNVAHVQTRIESHGLQSLVRLHGFVAEAALDQALESAHLAVNLRYPTMGETSYCQLRIWDHALPSLVTPVGWYATIPEAAVDFVRPDREVEDIRAHLTAFLAEPARYTVKGQNGRRLLEENHTPDAYAQAIVAFAAEVQRFRARSLAYSLAGRVSAELCSWCAPRLEDQGCRKAAEEILGLVA